VTRLVAMDEADFAGFAKEAPRGYAKDQVEAGAWSPDKALELATADFKRLLPQGLGTPDHFLFVLRDSTNQAVGILWFARKERAGTKVAYVYSIFIREKFRRKGHAASALRALEGHAQSMGLAGIELHVFGQNAKARALYQKIGFHETNVTMFKSLRA
jgi:ribosomal protein S18 acetylase RimI-like enzyme